MLFAFKTDKNLIIILILQHFCFQIRYISKAGLGAWENGNFMIGD